MHIAQSLTWLLRHAGGSWWHAGGNFQYTKRCIPFMVCGIRGRHVLETTRLQCTVESFDPAHSPHLFHTYCSCKCHGTAKVCRAKALPVAESRLDENLLLGRLKQHDNGGASAGGAHCCRPTRVTRQATAR